MAARGISVRTLGTVLVAALAALFLARAGAQAAATATATAPPLLKVQTIGLGTVTGNGIDCGNGSLTCTASYSRGGSRTLTETPATGWTFVRWEDDCSGSSSSCDAQVVTDQTVTAVFATNGPVDTSSLDVSLGGTGTGTVTNSSQSSGASQYPINCAAGSSAGCSVSVPRGSTLTVEEKPANGIFQAWGGSCNGDRPTCSVQIQDSRAISASFVSNTATQLTVTVDGPGSVGVDNYTCTSGSICTYDEPPNATLGLTAIPAKGYAFTGWTGDCAGTQNQCQVQMTTDHQVTATFAQLVPILLTIGGDGTVTGPGINCGPGPVTCNATAAPNTTLQLTAVPGSTSTGDVSWAGCGTSAGTICTVDIGSEPESIEADFTGSGTSGGGGGGGGGGSVFSVHASVSGNGYVTALGGATLYCTAGGGNACTTSAAQNSSITLIATPVPGATFSAWGGACAGASSSCVLVMNGAKTVTASFTGLSTTHTLTAAIGGGGSGTVTGGGIHCTATGTSSCTSPEPVNLTLTLTATAAAGSTFTGWSGGCSGTSPLCTLSMTAEQSVTANFSGSSGGGGGGQSETLSLDVTGGGKVTLPAGDCPGTIGKPHVCTAQFRNGTVVALKAVPIRGYAFAGWKGACTGKKAACSVTMDALKTVSATFTQLALAPGAKKPAVRKVAGGYRITLSFLASQAGRLTALAKHRGAKPVKAAKTIKPGAGTIRVTVKKTGRWVVILTLRAKSGLHAIRYTVRI